MSNAIQYNNPDCVSALCGIVTQTVLYSVSHYVFLHLVYTSLT